MISILSFVSQFFIIYTNVKHVYSHNKIIIYALLQKRYQYSPYTNILQDLRTLFLINDVISILCQLSRVLMLIDRHALTSLILPISFNVMAK